MKKLTIVILMMSQMAMAQWTRVDINSTYKCYSLESYFLNADTGFVNMFGSVMYRTTNGGASWNEVYSYYDTTHYCSYINGVQAMDFVNDSVGYAVGGKVNHFYKTTDAGSTWTNLDNNALYNPDNFKEAIKCINDTLCYVLNRDRFYLLSGSELQRKDKYVVLSSFGFNQYKARFSMVNDSTFIYDYGHFRVSIDYGNTWSSSSLGIKAHHYLPNANKIVAHKYPSKSFFTSYDLGNTWVDSFSVAASIDSFEVIDIDFFDDSIGIALFGADLNYFLGDDIDMTKLFYTKNGGKSWYLFDRYNNLAFSNIFILDANVAYISGKDGIVMKTTNAAGIRTLNSAKNSKLDSQKTVSMHPNPNNGKFVLNHEKNAKTLIVKNLLGQTVHKQDIKSENKTDIQLQNFCKGLYIVEIEHDNGEKATLKMVVE